MPRLCTDRNRYYNVLRLIYPQPPWPKKKTGKAQERLAFIQRLYWIEKQIKILGQEERYQQRQEQTVPVYKQASYLAGGYTYTCAGKNSSRQGIALPE